MAETETIFFFLPSRPTTVRVLKYASRRSPRARMRSKLFFFPNFQILIGGYSHHYDKVGTFFGAPSHIIDGLMFSTKKMKVWHVGRLFATNSQMLQSLIKRNVSLDTASTVEHFPLCQSVEWHWLFRLLLSQQISIRLKICEPAAASIRAQRP